METHDSGYFFAPKPPRLLPRRDPAREARQRSALRRDELRKGAALPGSQDGRDSEEKHREHLQADVDERGWSPTARAMRRGSEVSTGTRPSPPSKGRPAEQEDEHALPARNKAPKVVHVGESGRQRVSPRRGMMVWWHEGSDPETATLHHGKVKSWGHQGAHVITKDHADGYDVAWTDLNIGHHPSVAAEVEEKARVMREHRDRLLADVTAHHSAFAQSLTPEQRAIFFQLSHEERDGILSEYAEHSKRRVAKSERPEFFDYGETLDLVDDPSVPDADPDEDEDDPDL